MLLLLLQCCMVHDCSGNAKWLTARYQHAAHPPLTALLWMALQRLPKWHCSITSNHSTHALTPAPPPPRQVKEAMYAYGKHLGLAFQVVDDILDFTQSTEQLGKPQGQDLASGNLTAPVIFALQVSSARQHRPVPVFTHRPVPVFTHRPVPVFTLCLCSPCACVHPVPVFTLCLCSPCACVHPVPVFTLCLCSPCACVHPVPVFTLCLCSPTASVSCNLHGIDTRI